MANRPLEGVIFDPLLVVLIFHKKFHHHLQKVIPCNCSAKKSCEWTLFCTHDNACLTRVSLELTAPTTYSLGNRYCKLPNKGALAVSHKDQHIIF